MLATDENLLDAYDRTMGTGWWGIPGTTVRTKVHLEKDGRPICNTVLRDGFIYQWVSRAASLELVDCKTCQRVYWLYAPGEARQQEGGAHLIPWTIFNAARGALFKTGWPAKGTRILPLGPRWELALIVSKRKKSAVIRRKGGGQPHFKYR